MRTEYDFSKGKRGAIALINAALRAHIGRVAEPLDDTLRRVVREELKHVT